MNASPPKGRGARSVTVLDRIFGPWGAAYDIRMRIAALDPAATPQAPVRGRPPLMDWLEIAGAVFLTWLVLVFLFTPHINYHLSRRTSVHAEDFLYTLQSTCQAALHHGNQVTIYTNGSEFYPAMIDAIVERDAIGQHGVLHLPAGPSPISSSTRSPIGRARA